MSNNDKNIFQRVAYLNRMAFIQSNTLLIAVYTFAFFGGIVLLSAIFGG